MKQIFDNCIGISNCRYPCPLSDWEKWNFCSSHKGFLLL